MGETDLSQMVIGGLADQGLRRMVGMHFGGKKDIKLAEVASAIRGAAGHEDESLTRPKSTKTTADRKSELDSLIAQIVKTFQEDRAGLEKIIAENSAMLVKLLANPCQPNPPRTVPKMQLDLSTTSNYGY